ncbi:DUF2058 domain-containing protein [Aestuariibacter halophilus]|uniref:DUF2058 domain-containing protein n=1 Tax=Fluctibacter halophilus TaxID=226011 RepID=A0ABS8G7V9_9ALTE|nr:DUF2058 domain-containing protein [Aestuariibacter halophilus]MCC2615774.1 DUF2058 domain-containing protein [Aestuariibacter halophilus]
MALSLQEQLLKAGLADKKKVQQVKREKHKKTKQQQKHKVVEVSESKLAAEQAKAQKIAKDKALNAKAKAEAEQKAIAAQIKQLIELNRQPKDNGDVACNFTDGTVIKRLYVNQTTQNRISQGKLAIVRFGTGYELVPMPVADKIAQRDEQAVVYRVDQADVDTSSAEEDDWYADYQIPDDLTW